MSFRGLIPLGLGGALAYFAYKKKEEGGEASAEDEGLDVDPIEELMREKKARESAENAAKESAEKESAG